MKHFFPFSIKLHCSSAGNISSHCLRLFMEKKRKKKNEAPNNKNRLMNTWGVSSISCPGYRNTEHTAVNFASDFARDDSVCSCDEMADSISLLQ